MKPYQGWLVGNGEQGGQGGVLQERETKEAFFLGSPEAQLPLKAV